MADIITSIEPGQYTTGQTLTVKFPPGTRKAIVTRTDKAPVLTEVLAYDVGPITPNPPPSQGGTGPVGPDVQRPFLVVTQDGRGNVVYDGGFPKFYNSELRVNGQWPAALPSTFSALTGASKYMYNAFNFCANPREVANGNRKVLLINNADKNYDYYILGSHFKPYPGQPAINELCGFRDTFDAISKIGNWEPTYYTYNGSMIDIPLTELQKYTHIVFISSQGGSEIPGAWRTTENFAAAVAAYRALGGGVIIITDHSSYNLTSVEDAMVRGDGFVPDANRLATKFDCYFSGNVDRVPMLVGEIRRQIGLPGPPATHPLLDNLSDDEYIYAGGSESVIFPKIYTDEEVPTDEDLVVQMSTAGTYYVNVLTQDTAGVIQMRPMRFVIIDPSDINISDNLGRLSGATTSTYKQMFDYTVDYSPGTPFSGNLYVNDVLVGYFRYVGQNDLRHYFFSGPGSNTPVKNNDVIKFKITYPFEWNVSTTIKIIDLEPVYSKSGQVSTFIKALRTVPNYVGLTDSVMYADAIRTGNLNYTAPTQRTLNTNFNWFQQMKRARLGFTNYQLAECNMYVPATPAVWEANKATAVNTVGSAVIVASTNDVYYYSEATIAWELHPVKANVLFGLGRTVKGQDGSYVINASNTTLIS